MKPVRYTLRAIGTLLDYPQADRKGLADAVRQALDDERALRSATRERLAGFAADLERGDAFELAETWVSTFDRGRMTSLHLFEHVHGDSRDRGQAMIDLARTYEAAGLVLGPGELPDHLPVALEFASTQPPAQARDFLQEMAHILRAVFSGLLARQTAYASVLAALLDLAGERAEAVKLADEPDLDEAWAEPAAFDGCSTAGQARPGTPQRIRIVKKPSTAPTAGAPA
jgi:nitrate reductase delta subunit